MKQILPLLAQSPLMAGIPQNDMAALLACLDPQLLACQKDQMILQQDDPARFFGIVLTGSVQVLHGDIHGAHTLIANLNPGELFGETFACASLSALPVNVIATGDCSVLLFDHSRVVSACATPCKAHSQLILNLLHLIAQKNLLLSSKLEIVMQRTTRGKLLAYLRAQAKQAGSSRFTIPFDRQALADYLGVERSAMSTELNRLKKDGIILFSKNEFEFPIA